MEEYITVPGSPALSDFRRRSLATKLGVKAVYARYLHYVALKGVGGGKRVDPEQLQQTLKELLTYGEEKEYEEPQLDQDSTRYFVFPRRGTISPWSSKATNVAVNCGLETVKRIERGVVFDLIGLSKLGGDRAPDGIHDRMTEMVSQQAPDMEAMFADGTPAPLNHFNVGAGHTSDEARAELRKINKVMSLSLDDTEIEWLVNAYDDNGTRSRAMTDVELMTFASYNSDHCRHKVFNASYTIDGVQKPQSLFEMIRNTHRKNSRYVRSAYSDNAAVMEAPEDSGSFLAPRPTGVWAEKKEKVHYLAKVETHNHPTGISPFPGAATGAGGEIRDEGAVGRGSAPRAGLTGYCVSALNIPGFKQPWDLDVGKPDHPASSLEIMLEAPIGGASYNNEWGRPCLSGFFRSYSLQLPQSDSYLGYHKPIMLAGGHGTVRSHFDIKDPEMIEAGDLLVVLGGPALAIGLNGASASSATTSEASTDLDFASVQRGNAELQRRAQEVINSCVALGPENPIRFIHDVGAGGLGNALGELVNDVGLGATIELRDIDNGDRGMSPMEIWSGEAQERYVLAISEGDLSKFKTIADRERSGFSVVGKLQGSRNGDNQLVLTDRELESTPIDLSMKTLFAKLPRKEKSIKSRKSELQPFKISEHLSDSQDALKEATDKVLSLPSVGSKSFLITIGDRTVGGITMRDQFCGKWQIPVSDVSVTATSLTKGIQTGVAMACGEKPTIAPISSSASARMAVAEALMNLAAAHLLDAPDRLSLSANWMANAKDPGEAAALYEAVEALSQFCISVGCVVPVGKDSMSMSSGWRDEKSGSQRTVTSPVTVVVTAYGIAANIYNTWTPALRRSEDDDGEESVLIYVDLADGKKRLGGSALAQTHGQIGDSAPDVSDPQVLKDFLYAVEELHEEGFVLAYHDRSDGGLLTTIAEMCFAGRCPVQVWLDDLCGNTTEELVSTLFNEELGAVFQIRSKDELSFTKCFANCGPPEGMIRKIGRILPKGDKNLTILHSQKRVFQAAIADLQQTWSATSWQMARIRDNPECADAEYNAIREDFDDPGLSYKLTFNPNEPLLPLHKRLSSQLWLTSKPPVAILREQGINGQAEMAFAFMQAGFTAVDVHMSDLISGRVSLSSFTGLAACGGFSYGDTLGAGQGWAKSVLHHRTVRKEFQNFFERKNTFTLGVCNGAQFLVRLKSLIPGADNKTAPWPTAMVRNRSEQFEARFSMVQVLDNDDKDPNNNDPTPTSPPSVFLHGMAGSALPIAVSNGEGRAFWASSSPPHQPSSSSSSSSSTSSSSSSSQDTAAKALLNHNLVAIRYVDNRLQPTEKYPANPGGSPSGIAGVRSPDGRVLAMMPHPERCLFGGGGSYVPEGKGREWEFGPWIRLFRSARRWVG